MLTYVEWLISQASGAYLAPPPRYGVCDICKARFDTDEQIVTYPGGKADHQRCLEERGAWASAAYAIYLRGTAAEGERL